MTQAPMVQNQELPMMAHQARRLGRTAFTTRRVSARMFQPTWVVGAAGVAGGMRKAAAMPRMAEASPVAATICGP